MMELEEYLAVPYKLIMESFEGLDGDWLRRASYPELPGCHVEGLWAVDVVESLEQLRVQLITERFQHRQYIPVPRPPLKSHGQFLDHNRLGFAKYLLEHGRINEG
jgi:hypothetical protein